MIRDKEQFKWGSQMYTSKEEFLESESFYKRAAWGAAIPFREIPLVINTAGPVVSIVLAYRLEKGE